MTGQAAAHIEAGRYAAAYELLAPLEPERAGDPGFDLMLGVAALESGQATRAVFALERVLAVQPDNLRARAEIGRAYLALGESSGARRELEAVRGQDVPPEVAATIDRLLAAVNRAPDAAGVSFTAYVEAFLGRDTNANSASSLTSVAVPSLSGLVLDISGGSRRKDAWFTGVSGGGNVRVPLNREWSALAGASGTARFNSGASSFDTTAFDGYGGVAWNKGKNRVTALAQGGVFWVGDFFDGLDPSEGSASKLRDYTGGSVQWQHTHDARNQTTVFAQHSRLRYEGGNEVRDADRTIYGVGHAIVLPGERTMLFGSLYTGLESGRNDLPSGINVATNDVMGFRVGAQYSLDERWMFHGTLAHESRDYRDVDPAFLAVRDDTLSSLHLGASYMFAKQWLLLPSVTLTRNESNIGINDYRRGVAQFAVRRTF